MVSIAEFLKIELFVFDGSKKLSMYTLSMALSFPSMDILMVLLDVMKSMYSLEVN